MRLQQATYSPSLILDVLQLLLLHLLLLLQLLAGRGPLLSHPSRDVVECEERQAAQHQRQRRRRRRCRQPRLLVALECPVRWMMLWEERRRRWTHISLQCLCLLMAIICRSTNSHNSSNIHNISSSISSSSSSLTFNPLPPPLRLRCTETAALLSTPSCLCSSRRPLSAAQRSFF